MHGVNLEVSQSLGQTGGGTEASSTFSENLRFSAC
jgi:hypothetical protein